MTNLTLPENILQTLSTVLQQVQQFLPELKQQTDFSAPAYKWQDKQLKPIFEPKQIYLDDLKGIERQKEKIIQNTRQFLQNLPANDVLLTGSRGTGKSSIVRALLTEYKDQGLRLIEIERDDLSDLPEIQKLIQKRPEKFIVYCDDLAFNAEDRHLLPEFMHENTPVTRVDVPQYTELHPQEAIEEKISLSDRFGMWLSFYPMDQNLYLTIVEHYLAKTDMPMNDEAHAEALRWCQARGQRSGRAAYQFSKHWIGSQQLKAL